MGHGKFIVKKRLKTWAKPESGAKSKIQDGWAFSLQQTGVEFLCYCGRNAALNSEIAGPGWHRLWMSLQRRKERCQSETEEEKVKKRRKKREKKCLCFDMGGMRRNRRITLKDFLIISYSLTRFLFQETQKDTATAMPYASTTERSFSSQSLDNKIQVTFTTQQSAL